MSIFVFTIVNYNLQMLPRRIASRSWSNLSFLLNSSSMMTPIVISSIFKDSSLLYSSFSALPSSVEGSGCNFFPPRSTGRSLLVVCYQPHRHENALPEQSGRQFASSGTKQRLKIRKILTTLLVQVENNCRGICNNVISVF